MPTSPLFRFNGTLRDAISGKIDSLADEVERRIEQWVNYPRNTHMCIVQVDTDSIASGGSGFNLGFDTQIYDPYNWHSTSTNTGRITPTVTGWYRGVLAIRIGSGQMGANDRILSRILLNNSTILGGDDRDMVNEPAAFASVITTVPFFLDANEGDYVNQVVFQNSGSSVNVFGEFSLELVLATET